MIKVNAEAAQVNLTLIKPDERISLSSNHEDTAATHLFPGGSTKHFVSQRPYANDSYKEPITIRSSSYSKKKGRLKTGSISQFFDSGIRAVKSRLAIEYTGVSKDINFTPGVSLSISDRRNILIVTTWRSGSTFLGDILKAYPGTFYSFEPLHSLLGNNRFNEEEGEEMQQKIIKRIRNIMECNLKDQDDFLEHARSRKFLLKHNSRYWKSCSPKVCFDAKYFNQVCLLYFKTKCLML